MSVMERFLVLGLCLSLLLAQSGEVLAAEPLPAIDFQRDVRPILAEHCLACHGNDLPEAGVRLSTRATIQQAGESGKPAVVPGKPQESELVHRIRSADPAERMPPEGKPALKPEEVATLERWIAEGAPWGEHWAFEAIRRPSLPATSIPGARNAIDRFVHADLEGRGWMPSPEADRYTLIRRLSYDLRGLPPTIEEVDEFVADSSDNAYGQLVERMLESPHFGERWGRHWLDLAHYADSDGYEKDRARPDAFRYRDWVIASFNRDQPFDQFTIDQLAGDLVPGATGEQRLATAFLRQTLTNEEGGVDQEEYRVAACFDRTDTVGTVWLGLTIGCARCHTHKYDPIPHADYYRFFAFFNNSEEDLTSIPIGADNLPELERQLAPLEASLQARYRALAHAEAEWERLEREAVMSVPTSPLKELPAETLSCVSASRTSGLGETPAVKGSSSEAPDRTDEERTSAFSISGGIVRTSRGELGDDYVVRLNAPASITGFKLYALADKDLPSNGPGLAENGNFVITGLKLFVDHPDGSTTGIPLHRPQADYSQKGYPPEEALRADPSGRAGWAVGGKTGENHWIQARTRGAVDVPANATARLVIEQRHGKHHTLGAFRIAWLQGDARGLHLPTKQVADALEMYPEKRVAATRRLLFRHYVEQVARDAEVERLHREIAALQKRHKAQLVEVRTMSSPRLPRTTRVFHRGEFLSPKEEVTALGLEALPAMRPRTATADRLDLAKWLVAPENPLTARVAVNHVWQHLFGRGLVPTVNDFGIRGERPSHPELLDWLARAFQHDLKWSRKGLIRLIVGSATYRQASAHRPEYETFDSLNTTLFRQNRFRVEAEVVRDLALSASGLLSSRVGGPSVFPSMPPDLAALSYANNFSWRISTGEDRYRRGLYTFFKRTIPHPSLMTFDAPDANVTCAARTVSNTPLQSLTLLNNETHHEAARALAARALQEPESATDLDRLRLAFRLCVARPPQSGELATLERVLQRSRDWYRAHGDDARALLGEAAAKTVDPAELAAWTATVRVPLNLDEFLTRE